MPRIGILSLPFGAKKIALLSRFRPFCDGTPHDQPPRHLRQPRCGGIPAPASLPGCGADRSIGRSDRHGSRSSPHGHGSCSCRSGGRQAMRSSRSKAARHAFDRERGHDHRRDRHAARDRVEDQTRRRITCLRSRATRAPCTSDVQLFAAEQKARVCQDAEVSRDETFDGENGRGENMTNGRGENMTNHHVPMCKASTTGQTHFFVLRHVWLSQFC